MLLCLRRLSNGTRFASTFASCSACRVRSRASTPNIAANDSRPAASYPPALWCADEGTSRMQTSLRRRQRDRVVRRSVPLPSNSSFNSQPLPKRASTDRMQSSVPEQRSGDDDRGALPFRHCHHHHKHHPHLVHYSYWRMCVCFGRATSTRAHAHSRMRQPDCPTPQPPHAKTDRLCFFAMPSTDAGRQHFAGTSGVLNPCIHLSS